MAVLNVSCVVDKQDRDVLVVGKDNLATVNGKFGCLHSLQGGAILRAAEIGAVVPLGTRNKL